MDLFNILTDLQKQLDISVKQLRKSGSDYAEAYTSYRVALAQELLKLRDKNIPVTLCSDLARGNGDVARKKFQEISTEAIYLANKESINTLKLRIKIIQNQIEREWSNINE